MENLPKTPKKEKDTNGRRGSEGEERQMDGIEICVCTLSSSSPLPDYVCDYSAGPSLTQDHCDDMPEMIEDPEKTAWARVFRMEDPEEVPAAWKTIAAKPRVLQLVLMGASAQTTAATRDGGDPVSSGNSGRDGNDLVSPVASGKAASVRAANLSAALMPDEDCTSQRRRLCLSQRSFIRSVSLTS